MYFSFLPAAFFGAPPPTTASRACRASLFGFSRSSLSRLRNSLSSFPFAFSSAQRAAKRSRCACSAAFSGAFSTRRASRAWRRFSLRTFFQALPSALHQPPRCTSYVQPGGARPRGRGKVGAATAQAGTSANGLPTAPGICAPLRENLLVRLVVVVRTRTRNYLRQASPNRGKYFVLFCESTFNERK